MNAPSLSTAARDSLHVLVVDDDPFMQEMIGDMARELSAGRVSRASDGKAALTIIDRESVAPDLVICDLNMPNQDGFQLMESLAAIQYAGGVVILSGEGSRVIHSAELMAKFHHLRILGALQKPLSRQALQDAVWRLRKLA